MSAKNSKFSGIFAQAREREEEATSEIQLPEAQHTTGEHSTAQAEKEPHPMVKPEDQIDFEPEETLLSAAPLERINTENSAKKVAAVPQISANQQENRSENPVKTGALAEFDSSPAPSIGRPRGKRSDPNFTQITAYISKSTHQNVKIALLNEAEKREISELIEAQLVAWLASKSR